MMLEVFKHKKHRLCMDFLLLLYNLQYCHNRSLFASSKHTSRYDRYDDNSKGVNLSEKFYRNAELNMDCDSHSILADNRHVDTYYFAVSLPIGFCNFGDVISAFVLAHALVDTFKELNPELVEANKNNKDFVYARVYNCSTLFTLICVPEYHQTAITHLLNFFLEFYEKKEFVGHIKQHTKVTLVDNYYINKYLFLQLLQNARQNTSSSIRIENKLSSKLCSLDTIRLYFSHFSKLKVEYKDGVSHEITLIQKIREFNERLPEVQRNILDKIVEEEEAIRNQSEYALVKMVNSARKKFENAYKRFKRIFTESFLDISEIEELRCRNIFMIETDTKKNSLEVIIDFAVSESNEDRVTISKIASACLHQIDDNIHESLLNSKFATNVWYELCEYGSFVYRLTIFVDLTLEGFLHYPQVIRIIKEIICNFNLEKFQALMGDVNEYVSEKPAESDGIKGTFRKFYNMADLYFKTQSQKLIVQNTGGEEFIETFQRYQEWVVLIIKEKNYNLKKKLASVKNQFFYLNCEHCKGKLGCISENRHNILCPPKTNIRLDLYNRCKAISLDTDIESILDKKYQKIVRGNYYEYKYLFQQKEGLESIDLILLLNYSSEYTNHYKLIADCLAKALFITNLKENSVDLFNLYDTKKIIFECNLSYNTMHIAIKTVKEATLEVAKALLEVILRLFDINEMPTEAVDEAGRIAWALSKVTKDEKTDFNQHDVYKKYVFDKVTQVPLYKDVKNHIDFSAFNFGCTGLELLVSSKTLSYKFLDLLNYNLEIENLILEERKYKHIKQKSTDISYDFLNSANFIGLYYIFPKFDLEKLLVSILYRARFNHFVSSKYAKLNDFTQNVVFDIISKNFTYGYAISIQLDSDYISLKTEFDTLIKKFQKYISKEVKYTNYVNDFMRRDLWNKTKWNRFKKKYNINDIAMFHNKIYCLDYLDDFGLKKSYKPKKALPLSHKKIRIEHNGATEEKYMTVRR